MLTPLHDTVLADPILCWLIPINLPTYQMTLSIHQLSTQPIGVLALSNDAALPL